MNTQLNPSVNSLHQPFILEPVAGQQTQNDGSQFSSDLPFAADSARETKLSSQEHIILQQCEEIIKKGWGVFVEVGMAIAQIKESRLYRERYETFEAYCRANLPYTMRHANRLVAAAQVVSGLGPTGPILPKNENQVRHLIGLPKETAQKAWLKAVELAHGGEVSEKHVKAAVSEIKPPIHRSRKPSKRQYSPVNTKSIVKTTIGLLKMTDDFVRSGQDPTITLKLIHEAIDYLSKI